jgi:DNA-binding transcriptional MerR regulator
MTGQFSSNPAAVALQSTPSVSTPLRAPEMKSPTAFRTISEVATDLSVPQHVLRFWESKFQQIRPLKRGGGRRYYRPEDIQLISSIKDLLYNQGFTIRGVQKLLKENGRFPSARSMVPDPQVPASMVHHASSPSSSVSTPQSQAPQHQRSLSPEKRREIESVLSELKALRELLRQSGI